MAKKKKLTPLQVMYKKEVDRLKRAVKRAEKKGYEFDESVIPKMPKRVTKQALKKIQNYKTPSIYKKARKIDRETGEIVKGTDARKRERQIAYQKGQATKERNKLYKKGGNFTPKTPIGGNPIFPKFSDMVISNFLADMSRFPEVAFPIFKQWINELLAQYEKDDIAIMLENAKANNLFPDYSVAYNRDLVLSSIAQMMEHIPNASQGFKEELVDMLEYSEDWELPD